MTLYQPRFIKAVTKISWMKLVTLGLSTWFTKTEHSAQYFPWDIGGRVLQDQYQGLWDPQYIIIIMALPCNYMLWPKKSRSYLKSMHHCWISCHELLSCPGRNIKIIIWCLPWNNIQAYNLKNDVKMSMMVSQITSVSIVSTTVKKKCWIYFEYMKTFLKTYLGTFLRL